MHQSLRGIKIEIQGLEAPSIDSLALLESKVSKGHLLYSARNVRGHEAYASSSLNTNER